MQWFRLSSALLLWLVAVATIRAEPPDAAKELTIVPPPRGLRDTVARIQIDARLPAPPAAPVGNRRNRLERMRILVIPVATADATGGAPSREELDKTFFGSLLSETGGSSASVADYFRDTSYHAVTKVSGKVLDWIRLDNATNAYFVNRGIVPSRGFFEEVFAKADALVNYAEFDDDKVEGDRDGGQNDGFVDIVAIVSDFGPGNFNAFRWKMSLMDTPDSPAWTSSDEETLGTPGLGVTENVNVKIDDFIVIPAGRLVDRRIGVACHEILHFLGLPDLYNRNDWHLGGVGQWCIMCLGCNEMVNNGGDVDLGPSARFPPILAPWCRAQLGWGREVKPDNNGVAKLRSRQSSGDYFVIKAPDVSSSEAMYVEYYASPTNSSPWGKDILPNSVDGFLVWHADNDVGRNGTDRSFVWPSAAPSQGQNDAVFDWPLGSDHPLLRLIEADGKLGLEKGTSNYSDPGALFSNNALLLNQGDAGFAWYGSSSAETKLVFNVSPPAVQLVAKNAPRISLATLDATGSPTPLRAPVVPAAPSAVVLPSATDSSVRTSSVATSRLKTLSPAEQQVKTKPRTLDSVSNEIAVDLKSTRLAGKLKQSQVKISTKSEDVPETSDAEFRRLAKTIDLNGGADAKFAKDLSKAISLAASKASDTAGSSKQDLKSFSYESMENAVRLIGAEQSAKLLDSWQQARSRNAIANDKAAGFYGKYVDWSSALQAKTVVSPDGTSVIKLSANDLSIAPLDPSPEIDTAKRLWDIQVLTGLTSDRITLQIDKGRTHVNSPPGARVYVILVAHIGDKELPLNTRDNFGVVSYGAGNRLQNIEFNRPVLVKRLPEAVEPQRSVKDIIDGLCLALGARAPRREEITHGLELVLDPRSTGAGKWIPAYRIDLPLPTGPKQIVYFDADTGVRLE